MDAVYLDYDQAGLEAQYDNRAAVPEHEAIFADWAARSAAYRARAECRLDQAYGRENLETLDLFLPPGGAEGAPLHAFIHGGWWRTLDKSDFSYLAEPLVAAGAVVGLINYTLCPDASIETIVGQCRAALAWLYRNAADFGADPAKLHISGHSAGAQLAAMMLVTDWPALSEDLPADLVKSSVLISGVYELEPLLHLAVNADLKLDPAMIGRLSPIRMTPPAGIPVSVIAGEAELGEFRRQSRDFAATWTEGGGQIEFAEVSGRNHFTIVNAMDQADDPVTRQMLEFLG